jgi:hypothetical protein
MVRRDPGSSSLPGHKELRSHSMSLVSSTAGVLSRKEESNLNHRPEQSLREGPGLASEAERSDEFVDAAFDGRRRVDL